MNSDLNQLDITIENFATARLIIEKTTDDDINEISPMFLSKNVTQYVDLLPLHFHSIEDAKNYLQKDIGENNLMYTIRLKTTKEAIGQIGYYYYDGNMSIFYWIGEKYQNNGYATEAAIDLTNIVFCKSHLETFAIYFHCASLPAAKVALKVKNGLVRLHPEWEASYTEREVEKYTVSAIDDEKVTVKKTHPEQHGSAEAAQKRCAFPDELLSVGAKFELKCAFYVISKNKKSG